MKIKKIISILVNDFTKRTYVEVSMSILFGLILSIYNLIIGITQDSIWNKSIFGYYVFMAFTRAFLLYGEYLSIYKNKEELRHKFYVFSFIFVLLVNISMIAPTVILIQDKRVYSAGLIPAIAMAAYATYSIVVSLLNFSKTSKTQNIIIKQMRMIGIQEAVMAIIILQNTLILANGGFNKNMATLSTITSFVFLLFNITFSIKSFFRYIKAKK